MDKEYFINIEELKRSRKFITAEEVEVKKRTQKRQIIDLLLERFPGRATDLELNKISPHHKQRIKELRAEGWEIENVCDRSQPGKTWVAWLKSPVKGDRPYAPGHKGDFIFRKLESPSNVEMSQENQNTFKF